MVNKFGVIASDRQDYAMNKNGVSSIKSYHNSQKVIEINLIAFHLTKQNTLIDLSILAITNKIKNVYKNFSLKK